MKKFEVGDRVQFIYAGKLLTGRINRFSQSYGVLYAYVEVDEDAVIIKMQSGNIAKLEQPKPVEVKKPLFEHLESYHDFRVMPLLKVAKDFINSDFWDDYCDLKNDGEDWSLAIAKAMQNGYVVEEEPKTHSLKILPEYFDAIDHGVKTFEIRKNDRNFKVGDILILREYDEEHYTGPELKTKITYITDYAQQDGYVVLGIEIEVSE